MNLIRKIHPLLIFCSVWTISFWLFSNIWFQGQALDFTVRGFLAALPTGVLVGAAQYFLVPGNRIRKNPELE